ncbi:MAG: phosphodiesterase [Candidatus Gastranaerophilales bacterium]|nr:phosphodiesterase [Candidatus Gastranaerophilales bacterium]
MKWLIASDIHGSAYYCNKLLEAYDREGADRMLLLGDLLYHGPRNDLPEGYAPKEVIRLLNERREQIVCVRGNCEAEVDQMVLQFPVMADYCILCVEDRVIYATHGHLWGEDDPPAFLSGDILLCGHTHIPGFVEHEGYLYMNPGSVSLPKEGSYHGYMTLYGGLFEWKDLEGNVRLSKDLRRN